MQPAALQFGGVPYLDAYRLVAFDAKTGEQLFEWPAAVHTRRFDKGDIIINGHQQWRVDGVLDSSTARDWHIAVVPV